LQRILREIAVNILRGTVKLSPSQRKGLGKYKRAIRDIALKKTPLKKRLKYQQRGGFLGSLLVPVLSMVASAILS